MTVPTSTQQPPQSLESYLRMRASACLPGEPSVLGVVELTETVWVIELESGEKVVAKYHGDGAVTARQADDVLAVERRVLDLLGAQGCSVPRVLGADPQTLFVFYEYKGDQTVDDLCQQAPPRTHSRCRLGRELVDRFCQIESALAAHREELQHLASPAARIEVLPATAARAEAGALKGLARFFGLCDNGATGAALASYVREISRQLSSREPTLGSTDYNARNIVADGEWGRPISFIEFSRIGWDWSERRLVQYATSLGAGRPDGRFVSLIQPDFVEYYAHCGGDPESRAAALDGHHILFHLNAAALLFRALDEPHLPPHRILLRAWRNPQRRIAQLVELIATPLTGDRLCAQFRDAFAATVRHSSMEIDI